MFRRSIAPSAVFTLKDLQPSLVAARVPKPRGAVVLENKVNRSIPPIKDRVFDALEANFKSPIDYYAAVVKEHPWLGASRSNVDTFVSHSPLLLKECVFLSSDPEPPQAVVLFPSKDEKGAKRVNSGSAVSSPLAWQFSEFIKHAKAFGSEDFTSMRDGALCRLKMSSALRPPVELHLHRQFDAPKDALEYLRSMGHYLPFVHYKDDCYFGDDVVDALATGRVEVDPSHGLTHRHLASIKKLWSLGFDLELKGLNPMQVPRQRAEHGLPEAILVAQRLKFTYQDIRTVNDDGNDQFDLCVGVHECEMVAAPEVGLHSTVPPPGDSPLETAQRLLRGQTDFVQRYFAMNWTQLVNSFPQTTQQRVAEQFNAVTAVIEAALEAEKRQGKPKASDTTLTEAIQAVQQLCVDEDITPLLKRAMQSALKPCEDMVSSLKKQEKEQDGKRKQEQARFAYVEAVGNALKKCVAEKKELALSRYRQLSTGSGEVLMWPKEPGIEADLPFYDGIVPEELARLHLASSKKSSAAKSSVSL